MDRRGVDRARSLGAGGFRSQAAHSRLGERHDRDRQWRADGAYGDEWLCDHPPGLAKGDAVSSDLKMPAERFYAHPNVRMDVGLAALRRGPLIYCVEEAGIPAGRCRPCRCRAQRPSRPHGGPTCLAAPWCRRRARRGPFLGSKQARSTRPSRPLPGTPLTALSIICGPIERPARCRCGWPRLWANAPGGAPSV
jgi:hypothetical protein